ncbi:aminotransferase [Mesorhizobium sp. M2A.F.Ca.ET.039.01.1.1]|uniref:aminotransferase n=1 Tax=Mesorhizobium sp. M2A.F.Ca.ET.039.01.1.1 TaxID=2496746 RepID=UPI002692D885
MLQAAPNSIESRDMLSLIHPQTNLAAHLERGPEVITRGEGVFVFDNNGRRYLECAAGLWCATLGFSSERLAKAAYEQLRTLGYYHNYWHYAHEKSIELAEKLLKIAPVPMSRVLFQNSGSEANDTAIKLAWYHWNARGRPERRKIIGRDLGYHGTTIAAISASGKPDMQLPFSLPLERFIHTLTNHYYKFHEAGETEEAYSARLAQALEQLILAEGPETIAAFIAEPLIGAGGAIPPSRGYFEKIQAVLAKYEILFIADEVICGFGRTGYMWGSEAYGLKPDLIACAKGLSAGMLPIAAVLVGPRVYESMLEQSRQHGNFAHGSTYSGHPVSTAVALEVLEIYREIDVLSRVKSAGAYMLERLEELRRHPLVGDISGIGLVAGIDLVKDKASRTFYEPAGCVGGLVMRAARERGLLVRVIGDRITLSPPLIITESEIDIIVDELKIALDQVSATLSNGK